MSHEYNQQPRQGQTGRQPTQMAGEQGMTGGQQMGSQGMSGGQHSMTGSQRGSPQQMGGQGMGSGTQSQGTHGQQAGMQPAPSFEDHLTDELRLLLEDFSELSHITAWCAKECAAGAPELGICARICQDLAEVAELNEMLIARDSMFGPEVADMFIRVANEGLTELRRHQQQHPHITETIAAIERTMNSSESVLQQVGGQQTASQGMTDQMQGQQTGGQQTGGQQMGAQPMRNQQRSRGMPEQGMHGQGMSGQPTGRTGQMERQR